MTGANGPLIEKIANDFSASTNGRYKVNAVFKGQYPEVMSGAIAAFRAGQAPHIVQMFEVGTATMMAAGRAIKPVHELARETGVDIDVSNYLAPVLGYYATADGKPVSMPFNSSTTVMFYDRDAFQKAGLDPEKAPATWPELIDATRKLKAAGFACPFTTAWPTWTQVENFSAIHDVPLATKANGLAGMDAELKINSPVHVKHLQTLVDMQKEGLFKYGGRDGAADAVFISGECKIIHGSSGFRGRIVREAPNMKFATAPLPHWPDVPNAPKNSIIGGASLWVMTAPNRTADEYKAVAEFFRYLTKPEIQAQWHKDTGFLPITPAAYQMVEAEGFYKNNPGADIPFKQLNRPGATENTRGLRLGNMPQIRVIMQEEMEKALQGQQTAQQALDAAVQRGNAVLREFERANRS
jgi:sn-glycerol 3-phosphate transport system substrate-binding protein